METIKRLLEENQWSRSSPSLGGVPTCPICTRLGGLGIHEPSCWIGQALIELEKFRVRLVTTLEWMVTDTKWKADQTKGNLEEGSQGGYSKELHGAIALLNELKGVNHVE